MARPLRIEFDGALYHVMSRGNGRTVIVRDDRDRQHRLDWLQRVVDDFDWKLHAFCLMTNHDHLFVETPHGNLSAGMHLLNGSYAAYFNKRHRRVGHLFQGRFRSELIDCEGYFQEISRYIHLNPVRAGLVDCPEQYRWSSYPGYHSAHRALAWVCYDTVLGAGGVDNVKARAAYRAFVRAGLDAPTAPPWRNAVEGVIIGSPAYVERVQAMLHRKAGVNIEAPARHRSRPELDWIVDAVAKTYDANPAAWEPGRRCDTDARRVVAHVAQRGFGYSVRAVAAAVGYGHPTSVAHAVHAVERSKRLRRAARRLRDAWGRRS